MSPLNAGGTAVNEFPLSLVVISIISSIFDHLFFLKVCAEQGVHLAIRDFDGNMDIFTGIDIHNFMDCSAGQLLHKQGRPVQSSFEKYPVSTAFKAVGRFALQTQGL